MRNRFYRVPLLLSIFLSLLLLAGCSTDIINFRSSSSSEPKTAAQYLSLAEQSPPKLATEYRLRAAEIFIQKKEISEAQRNLRIAQLNQELEDSDRHLILETRLALLKGDTLRAKTLLKDLIERLTEQPAADVSLSGSMVGSQRIALILPTKGPHAEAAKTIRDGFLAAYYRYMQDNKSANITAKIYDTGDGSQIQEAYQKALSDQANFFVGPLTKPEVQFMAKLHLDYPVLALNTIGEGGSLSQHLYQFGLMPEDEVLAVGELALRQGHKRALVLAPQSEWGHRLTNTFKNDWKSRGGEIIDTQYYKSSQDVDAKIRSLLGVKNNQRRQDADMVFVAASPELARQIKPLFNLYFAEDLPVYATSAIYGGIPSPGKDHDLNGMQFCDMPWVLQDSSRLQEARNSMDKTWPNRNNLSRFFALGMDAFQLATLLGSSQDLSSQGVSGMTGNLYLNKYQRIQRGLVCAKFEQGIPQAD